MNGFENVCGPCPLRTKVDIDRATANGSMGSSGVTSTLSDGNNSYEVVLYAGEICDSDQSQAVHARVDENIKDCEGPITSLLRKQCGAGLASAWRWTETKPGDRSNLEGTSVSAIKDSLESADYRDAMPHYKESTWLVGDPRDFSELYLPPNSAFQDLIIDKLTQTVRGSSTDLPKGKAIMLDQVGWSTSMNKHDDKQLENVFRIRVAQAGPHFTFRYKADVEGVPVSYDDVLSFGIHAYLNSTTDTLEESRRLTEIAKDRANATNRIVSDFLLNGLSKSLKNGKQKRRQWGM
jgi:hypothetical protein